MWLCLGGGGGVFPPKEFSMPELGGVWARGRSDGR